MRNFSTAFHNKYTNLLTKTGFEMIVPKIFTHSNLSPDYDTNALTNGFSVPIYDMLERGGKAWRSSLSLMVSEILNLDQKPMLPLAQCVDLIHNASIIHDDIEDKSQKRRGKPCSYLIFGVDRALNAGMTAYFAPLMFLYSSNFDEATKQDLVKCMVEEFVNLHLGQTTDIEWNNTEFLPSEDQYLRMIINKTSVLVRMSVRLPLIVAKPSKEIYDAFVHHADSIGVSFQITDDLINLQSEEYAKGRSYVGEDITEGKKSLIIIRAVTQNPEKGSRLLEILRMKTKDLGIVNEALDIIKSTDAFEYCRKIGDSIVEESWKRLDRLIPDSEAKRDLYSLSFVLGKRKT